MGGPNTYPHLTTQRASVHDRPGARAGPTAGPPRLPNLMGSNGKAGMLLAAGLTARAGISHDDERPTEASERNSCGATHIDGHRDKAQHAQCHGGKTHRHSSDTCALPIDADRSTCVVKPTDAALPGAVRHPADKSCTGTRHSGTNTKTTSGTRHTQ